MKLELPFDIEYYLVIYRWQNGYVSSLVSLLVGLSVVVIKLTQKMYEFSRCVEK